MLRDIRGIGWPAKDKADSFGMTVPQENLMHPALGPMSAARSRTRAGLALAVGAALALVGCEDVDKGGRALAKFANQAKFGMATREQLATGAGGTTVRMMIESKAPANWMQADWEMSKQLRYGCRDGEAHSNVSEVPVGVWEGGIEAMERVHPAGTTFTKVIRCIAPPPYEFALEAGTSADAAREKVQALLQGDNEPDPQRYTVQQVSFNDRAPKYPAIASMLGYQLQQRIRDCSAGFSVHRLVVAAHPRTDESSTRSLNASYAVIGIDAPCLDDAAVAQPAPPG